MDGTGFGVCWQSDAPRCLKRALYISVDASIAPLSARHV